jgi:hypothetical protein
VGVTTVVETVAVVAAVVIFLPRVLSFVPKRGKMTSQMRKPPPLIRGSVGVAVVAII